MTIDKQPNPRDESLWKDTRGDEQQMLSETPYGGPEPEGQGDVENTRFMETTQPTPTSQTTHAYFSAAWALVHGSAVYRKPSGMTVNVTRTHPDKDRAGRHPWDERYVGEVIRDEDGGCVEPTSRVRGITRD